MRIFRFILLPFSALYWLITYVRNILYDIGFFKQKSFSVPIISVGNITVGGTGKTPHIQFLIKHLLQHGSVAVLSRGYKRSGKGYTDSLETSDVLVLGDESHMLHSMFPNVLVAVCENRAHGIQTILQKQPNISFILLDDAFQHRAVKPDYQIVLVDYNRPVWKDFVFPSGFLREGMYALQRADAVVVTKVPATYNNTDLQTWKSNMKISHEQFLCMSRIEYGNVYNAFTQETTSITKVTQHATVLLVTGIAQSHGLYDYIAAYTSDIVHFNYPDHFVYNKERVMDIEAVYEKIKEKKPAYILTTQKDEYKLKKAGFPQNIPLYVVPVQSAFSEHDATCLINKVLNIPSNRK